MIKTVSEVEQDFYNGLRKTSLIKHVSGKLYKHGLRPFDSAKEDVVVKITNLTADQIQEGTATVLVYVPNIDGAEVGRMTPNKKRLFALERESFVALKELKCYMPEYNNIRLAMAIGNDYDNELKQSFVSMRLERRAY